MSTPDDQNVERGQVVPPWKRGEKTSSTGKTAGEIAKAAGVDTGNRPAGGPPPRGVVSGTPSGTARPPGPAPTQAAPQGSPAQGSQGPGTASAAPSSSGGPVSGGSSSSPKGQSGPVQGPSQDGPAGSAPNSGPTPSGPNQPGPAQPGPKQSSSAALAAAGGVTAASSATGAPKPNPAQPGAQNPQQQAPSAAPGEQKKFVESDTRNIPREDLAKKDELPDLDAIHHVEASKEAKAAARAQSQTIPSRSIGVPLRAAVQIRRVDPWSVFKVTGVLAIVGFFIWMIAVAVLFGVLGGMGVWDQINSSFGTLVEGEGQSTGELISTGMVFGFSAVFGIVGAILLTGLATISAYIYNVCSDMVGGFEVTLADLD